MAPDFSRRCLITGALAGVVLEASLIAGFLWSKRPGASASFTTEMLPFVVVSALAFAVGAGAFLAVLAASLAPKSRKKRRR